MAKQRFLDSIRHAVINRIASGIAGKTSYDPDWFVRFMKLALDEDSTEGSVMTDPMRQQPWVNIAVTALASNLARAPFRLYQGETEVVSGPVWKLFSDVNANASRYELWEATESWMSTRGEAIWVFERDFAGSARAFPQEIWTPNPSRFKHHLNPEGTKIMMWEYEYKREKIPYMPDQIIHFRDWNPWDEWRGVSPLLALSEEAIADWNAARSTRKMFENDSTPSGVLSSDQSLTMDQAKLYRQMWEDEHKGMSRRHRISVLGSGTKYQSIQRTPQEMDYIPLRKFTRAMILARYGVPLGAIGIKEDATAFSGKDLQEQLKQFWTLTLTPKTKAYEDKLRTDFFGRFGLSMTGRFDLSEIAELKEDDEAVTKRELEEVRAGALTIDEYRERRGMKPVPWGKVWWIPFSMAPAGSNGATEEETPKTAGERNVTPRPTLVPAQALLGLSLEQVRELAEGGKSPGGNGHVVRSWPAEYRDAHWKAMIAWRDRVERHYTKALQAWLFAQRSRILEELVGGKTLKTPDIQTFDGQFGASYWKDQLAKLKALSGEDFGKTMDQTGKDVEQLLRDAGLLDRADAFDIYDTDAPKYLDRRVNQGTLADITNTVRKQLRDAIETGQREGRTIDQMADDIRHVYDVGKGRAKTIARTELGGIIGDSRYASFKSEGFEETEWLSAQDEKVRPSHMIDGDKVKIGEKFRNGLLYPNDPEGPPEEICNCRCLGLPVFPEAKTHQAHEAPEVTRAAEVEQLAPLKIHVLKHARVRDMAITRDEKGSIAKVRITEVNEEEPDGQ